MNVPSTKRLHGIWPPLLLETRPDGRIDLDAITQGTRYFASAGVHGAYTADTASEFYTLEFAEWNELVTHFRAVARECGLPAGAGCTWTNQAGALRRIARARELGFDHIHLSPPYWIKLNEPAQQTFWRAAGEAAGDLPIVAYAGSQGQFPLDGALVRRLRDWCPALAGTKSPGFDSVATNSLLLAAPELAHFVHETMLVPWVALGAAGCFSSLAGLCPPLALEWFRLLAAAQWGAAWAIQIRVNRFYEDGIIPIRRAGYIADKTVFELGRVPGVSRTPRAPYTAVPEPLVRGLEAAARAHLPEFAAALIARGL